MRRVSRNTEKFDPILKTPTTAVIKPSTTREEKKTLPHRSRSGTISLLAELKNNLRNRLPLAPESIIEPDGTPVLEYTISRPHKAAFRSVGGKGTQCATPRRARAFFL